MKQHLDSHRGSIGEAWPGKVTNDRFITMHIVVFDFFFAIVKGLVTSIWSIQ